QANADVTCENCGGAGHTKARCWHKGGDIEGQYPDWWIGKREASIALVPRSHMAYIRRDVHCSLNILVRTTLSLNFLISFPSFIYWSTLPCLRSRGVYVRGGLDR
ncbi:hypothetical protein R3P38DRAFT_2570545, partial [Favolaschia claudopus]